MLLKFPKTNNHKAKNNPDSFSFNKIYNMSVPPGLTEKCIAKSSMKKKKIGFPKQNESTVLTHL